MKVCCDSCIISIPSSKNTKSKEISSFLNISFLSGVFFDPNQFKQNKAKLQNVKGESVPMWKIAVADTAEDHLTLLKDALKAYFQETHRVFSVTSYTDLTFLEKDMAQGEHFDLLILDLVMNGQRSVEAVRRIREKEDGTPLIFLTANREYAVESYEMNALDYMIKPLKKERLVKRLDQLFKRKNPCFKCVNREVKAFYVLLNWWFFKAGLTGFLGGGKEVGCFNVPKILAGSKNS